MHWYSHLLAVASVWLVAAVSPGPNFLMAAQIAVARSRASGLAAVCGIAVATAIWGVCGLMGIQALFVAAPWAYVALKIAGAGFCLRGAQTDRARRTPVESDRDARNRGAVHFPRFFRIGMVTSLANPRSAMSVASIFAVTLPPHPSLPLGAAAIAVMVAISVAWYVTVVCLFAAGAVAGAYQRARRAIDRIAGGLLILFGAKLALDRGA